MLFPFFPAVLHVCMIPGAHERGPRTAPQSEQSATLPGGGAGAATSGYMARPPTVPPARPPQSGSQGVAPQSGQSAELFLKSSQLGLPQSVTRRRVCPPPPVLGGGAHTLAREGLGSPNSNEGTYTLVLFIYTYFVVSTQYRTQPSTSCRSFTHSQRGV